MYRFSKFCLMTIFGAFVVFIIYPNIIIITRTLFRFMTKSRVLRSKNFFKPNNLDKPNDTNFHLPGTESLATKEDFLFCSDIQKRAKLRIVEYCKRKSKIWREVKIFIDLYKKLTISDVLFNVFNRFYKIPRTNLIRKIIAILDPIPWRYAYY